jgi:hypothetical protein
MYNRTGFLDTIFRPRILIKTARIGLQWYRRERDLAKLINSANTPSPSRAVERLIETEGTLEEARKSGDVSYNVQRHISVLTALLAEARLLPVKVEDAV